MRCHAVTSAQDDIAVVPFGMPQTAEWLKRVAESSASGAHILTRFYLWYVILV